MGKLRVLKKKIESAQSVARAEKDIVNLDYLPKNDRGRHNLKDLDIFLAKSDTERKEGYLAMALEDLDRAKFYADTYADCDPDSDENAQRKKFYEAISRRVKKITGRAEKIKAWTIVKQCHSLEKEVDKGVGIYSYKIERKRDLESRRAGYAIRRSIYDSLGVKGAVTAVIIGLVGGGIFLSSNITGNAIANMGSGTSNILGAVFLLMALVGGFFWLKKRKN